MKLRSASPLRLSLLWLACLPAAALAQATTVATNPVGYLQTQCLGSSDTLVALPFTRMPAFTGAVASVSGSTVTLANNPSLSAHQFLKPQPGVTSAQVDTFYLTVGPGSQALTGTIQVTQGSAAVSGTNTTFASQLVAGDRLTFNDGYNQLTYTVAGVTDNFNLTFDRPYGDAAAPAAIGAPTAQTATAAKKQTGKVSMLVRAPGAVPSVFVGPQRVATKPQTNASSFSGLTATFDHSPLEGRWYIVSDNDASTVTVTLNGSGDSLAGLTAGTQVSIIPCWTLNTLYPAANAGVSFTPSTNRFQRATQVLIPSYSAMGINLSSAATYFYINDGTYLGWRLFGNDISEDHGNDYLMPDGYYTVRQDNNAPTVTMTFNGSVPVNKLVTPLATSSSQYQDNAVGLNRPADTTLNALGLSIANGSLQATTSRFSLQDQLFVIDNTMVSFNKSAAATYYYINDGTYTGWRRFGEDLTTDRGSQPIAAGSALILRKAPTASGQTVMWSNSPNY